MDAYNANPSSMRAALSSLSKMKAPQKGVILGDMLELGDQSEKEHFELGEGWSILGIDQVRIEIDSHSPRLRIVIK